MSFISHRNPKCTHDATSYTILNCEHCTAYAEQVEKERADNIAAKVGVPTEKNDAPDSSC